MSTKLTLTIEKEVIERAKAYAKSQERSLSNLIEEYLRMITVPQEELREEIPLTPLVKSLKGSIKVDEPATVDYKSILEEELSEKYNK